MPEDRKGRATYLVYRTLGTVLQAIPRPAASGLATMSGLTLAELWRGRRPIVRANLRRVLGPGVSERRLDQAVAEAFDSYAHYWVESARLASMRPAEVHRRFTIEGFEPVAAALDAKQGVILAIPHLGSWEVGGLWLTLEGYPMTTVAEPVEPPELFDYFVRQRSALGLTVYPLGSQTTARLVEALGAGRLVGLLCDRDLVGNGVEVEFFGETTTLPGGPAVLALRTGAPLFTAAVYQRPGDHYHGVVRPALDTTRAGRLRDDVTRVTQAIAHEFEELIRAEPAQWHLFQPNWPSDRPPEG